MVILTESLCGCSLKVSSLIIAWLSVVLSGFELLLELNRMEHLYVLDTVYRNLDLMNYEPKTSNNLELFCCSVAFTINTMLLVGIYKRNCCLMTPWILISGFLIALGFLAGIIFYFMSVNGGYALRTALQLWLTSAFGLYFYLLVYSYYTQIDEEEPIREDGHYRPPDV